MAVLPIGLLDSMGALIMSTDGWTFRMDGRKGRNDGHTLRIKASRSAVVASSATVEPLPAATVFWVLERSRSWKGVHAPPDNVQHIIWFIPARSSKTLNHYLQVTPTPTPREYMY